MLLSRIQSGRCDQKIGTTTVWDSNTFTMLVMQNSGKQASTKRRTSNGELYATYHIIYGLFALVVGPASGCSLRGHTSDIRHPVPDMRFAARCEARGNVVQPGGLLLRSVRR